METLRYELLKIPAKIYYTKNKGFDHFIIFARRMGENWVKRKVPKDTENVRKCSEQYTQAKANQYEQEKNNAEIMKNIQL